MFCSQLFCLNSLQINLLICYTLTTPGVDAMYLPVTPLDDGRIGILADRRIFKHQFMTPCLTIVTNSYAQRSPPAPGAIPARCSKHHGSRSPSSIT